MNAVERAKAETIANKLTDYVIAHGERFDGEERDEIGHVIRLLHEIADGER